MNQNIISGRDFAVMVSSGAKMLALDCEKINALNVFPVPDGDTGANMKMTIDGGVSQGLALGDIDIATISKQLAKSMVMSARGNSGVILSSFFKGVSLGLVEHETATVKELAVAFTLGTKRCYEVVTNPTEGTILTIMREAGEYAINNFTDSMTLSEFLAIYLEEANRSLARTPELLPCLKEAGVVDSGAAGFIRVVEGMYKASIGEEIHGVEDLPEMEVNYEQQGNLEKVHKKYAVVSVANGPGIKALFEDIGVDVVVSGGQTMNTSTKDFIKAFDTLDAEYILVYPNNGNIRMAAEAAREIYEGAKIIVIPTKTISQGYSCISLLNFEDDIDTIVQTQKEEIANVNTIEVTYSIRDCNINGIEIKKDDHICLLNDNLVSADINRLESVKKAINNIEDFKDKSIVTLIYGKDANEDEVNEIVNYMTSLNTFIEVYPVFGEQDIYSYIIGIE